jgi:hypothetical protein
MILSLRSASRRSLFCSAAAANFGHVAWQPAWRPVSFVQPLQGSNFFNPNPQPFQHQLFFEHKKPVRFAASVPFDVLHNLLAGPVVVIYKIRDIVRPLHFVAVFVLLRDNLKTHLPAQV